MTHLNPYMTMAERFAAVPKVAPKEQGNWHPACGGTEVPFTSRSGRKLLYVFQPATGRHAYLDCATDLILTMDESNYYMGLS